MQILPEETSVSRQDPDRIQPPQKKFIRFLFDNFPFYQTVDQPFTIEQRKALQIPLAVYTCINRQQLINDLPELQSDIHFTFLTFENRLLPQNLQLRIRNSNALAKL